VTRHGRGANLVTALPLRRDTCVTRHVCCTMMDMKHKAPLSQKQYAELGYTKLHAELKRMLAQAERITKMFNAGSRHRLLPALYAMRELTAAPGQRSDIEPRPSWESECRLLGITAEQVRQWKHRTAAETDIRHLVGEERALREKNTAPSNARALAHLARLTAAVLDGNEVEAEKLAMAYQEVYGF
jgi:hypothetical protein